MEPLSTVLFPIRRKLPPSWQVPCNIMEPSTARLAEIIHRTLSA